MSNVTYDFINKTVIVTGASRVPMENGMVFYFVTTVPDGTEEEKCERYGITYKEYRCPMRIFAEAIEGSFPFTAHVTLRKMGNTERLRVVAMDVIKRLAQDADPATALE